MYTYSYMYMWIYVYIYIYMYGCICRYIYIHICTYTHTHTHIFSHKHTRMCGGICTRTCTYICTSTYSYPMWLCLGVCLHACKQKEFRSVLRAIDRDAATVIKDANDIVFARVADFVQTHATRKDKVYEYMILHEDQCTWVLAVPVCKLKIHAFINVHACKYELRVLFLFFMYACKEPTTFILTSAGVYIYKHMYTYVYICMHIYVYIYVYVHVCTYICMYTYVYIYVCIHMYIYTHIYTHI